MDCQMPVLDGYTATRRWREHEASRGGRRLPIVAMTANVMAGDRQRCLDAGMDDYLSKPVAREQLEACLQRWLQQAAAAAAAAQARAATPAAPPAPAAAVAAAAPVPAPHAAAVPPHPPATAAIPPAAVSAIPAQAVPAPAAPRAPATQPAPAIPAAPLPVAAPAPAAVPSQATPQVAAPPLPHATAATAPMAQHAPPPEPEPPAVVLDIEMLDELRQIAGDDAAAIVSLFLEDAPRLVRQLEQASIVPDLDAMGEAAHALKSSSANIGAL